MIGVERAPQIDRIVVFRLEDQRYALPVDRVQEIHEIVEPTRLPDTSPALLGMIDLRGRVVPLLDLRVLIGMPKKGYELRTPMVIARTGDQLVALVVDEVDDVVDVPEGAMREPSVISDLASRMLGVFRVNDGLVFVLDVESLVPEGRVADVHRLAEGAHTDE